MTKSAKVTTETPGKMVKQKSGLNRVITQQSWGMFFEMLEYKLVQNVSMFQKKTDLHKLNLNVRNATTAIMQILLGL